MLTLIIPEIETFDHISQTFGHTKAYTLSLEHSLVSLSKWESFWKKPFLVATPKTVEESIDYIKRMTLTQNIPSEAYMGITNEHIKLVSAYIEDPMTATTFSKDENRKRSQEIVTAEIIYYWMTAHNIPWEAQKWHLNKLLTLISVCNIKAAPPKKMSRREIINRNSKINEERKQRLNTTG